MKFKFNPFNKVKCDMCNVIEQIKKGENPWFVKELETGYGISKEYRGKGYGDILFKELLKKCKEHGYKEIKLFPLKTNEATVKIMLKNGGKIIGDFKGEKQIILIPLQ